METTTAAPPKTEAPQSAADRQGIIQWAAMTYGVDPGKVMGTLRATCFRTGPNEDPATDFEVAALLVVAREYGLNPFTREIFAFKDKHKGVVPIVSIDGWSSLVNRHPDFDGVEFEAGPEVSVDHGGKKAFAWMKCRMFHKRRSKPIEVIEYLDELYVGPRGQNQVHGPWQTHPKRMERHKAYVQCGRLAFGFGGLFDEDEGERIIGAGAGEPYSQTATSTATGVATEVVERKDGVVEPGKGSTRASGLAEELRKKAADPVVDAEILPEPKRTAKTVEAPTPTPTPTPAPTIVEPTIESVRAEIKAAGSLEQLNKILMERVMKFPPSSERDALMAQDWNGRVRELTGHAAPPDGFDGKATAQPQARRSRRAKPPGGDTQLDDIVDRMDKATDMDLLNTASDLSREYTWTAVQQALLNDKYAERQAALR